MPKRRILLVDDDADILAFLKARIGGRYDLTSTNEPKNVLALARKHNPDLIVCDIHMPGIDGVEISKQLRADPALRDIPLLFLTGLASPDEMKRLSGQLGGRPAISKGEPIEKLIARIETLLP